MGIFDFLVSGVTYETVEDNKKIAKTKKNAPPVKQVGSKKFVNENVPDKDLPIVRTPSGSTRKTTVMELSAFDAIRLGNQFAAFEGIKVYEPNNFSDVERLLDLIYEKTTLIVNIKKPEELFSQRIIDYLSGAAYVLNLTIEKVGEYMYYIYLKK